MCGAPCCSTRPFRTRRQINSRLPSSPRCKMCAAPFAGPGGLVMRLTGHARWPKNPKYCVGCFRALRDKSTGAGKSNAHCSSLTSAARRRWLSRCDRRNSRGSWAASTTRRARSLSNTTRMSTSSSVTKIIGLFVPALTGDAHAERAIELRASAAGGDRARRCWPLVDTGRRRGQHRYSLCRVGRRGGGRELTAMGDVVNTTARLASAAAEGEILITSAAASSADSITCALAAALAVPEGQERPQRCSR